MELCESFFPSLSLSSAEPLLFSATSAEEIAFGAVDVEAVVAVAAVDDDAAPVDDDAAPSATRIDSIYLYFMFKAIKFNNSNPSGSPRRITRISGKPFSTALEEVL